MTAPICLSQTSRPQPLRIVTVDTEATVQAQALRGEIAEVCGLERKEA
jgi:hypothetical protein